VKNQGNKRELWESGADDFSFSGFSGSTSISRPPSISELDHPGKVASDGGPARRDDAHDDEITQLRTEMGRYFTELNQKIQNLPHARDGAPPPATQTSQDDARDTPARKRTRQINATVRSSDHGHRHCGGAW
jgi:hypothetical protein